MTKIVWKFFFCSLHLQWWFDFLEKVLTRLEKVSSIQKLSISKVEGFIRSNFDLSKICKKVLTQNH